MSGEMKKPVNPNSPWRKLPTLPQVDKSNQSDKQQQINFAVTRLAEIDAKRRAQRSKRSAKIRY